MLSTPKKMIHTIVHPPRPDIVPEKWNLINYLESYVIKRKLNQLEYDMILLLSKEGEKT